MPMPTTPSTAETQLVGYTTTLTPIPLTLPTAKTQTTEKATNLTTNTISTTLPTAKTQLNGLETKPTTNTIPKTSPTIETQTIGQTAIPSSRGNPCQDGEEILISSSLKAEGFPLSRVLVELLERGLNVVSYVSTKANEMSLHIIQCEASDIRCNDLSTLTGRLTDVINLRRDNS
ncbi:unnamed protein product [Fraxinus pennsylvanica]|uniref:Uncharacterized protein n=1 Tax=Fraxinus pennsylvanica TaxID=56036 RepID=A0AAD2DXR4_9LAMI|nr:unnamed protein product [Fraxinus pennsylvanica]